MAFPSTALSRGNLVLLYQLISSHSSNKSGNTALGAQPSHPIPLPCLHGREGSSFLGLVAPNEGVKFKSVVGMKSVSSGVVIG